MTHISPLVPPPTPFPHAICILFLLCQPTIHYMALPNLFWLELISHFLPMRRRPSPRGWNLTCNRVSRRTAKSTWSSSSCPAGSRERSGTRSRSWFWPPWCRLRTGWRWRGNLCDAGRQTGTALKDTRGNMLCNSRRLEMFHPPNWSSMAVRLSCLAYVAVKVGSVSFVFICVTLMALWDGRQHLGNRIQQWFIMSLACDPS